MTTAVATHKKENINENNKQETKQTNQTNSKDRLQNCNPLSIKTVKRPICFTIHIHPISIIL